MKALEPFCFDLQQIKQALLNILVNALDATLPGDTIRLPQGVRDGKVDVIIQDSGQGIDKRSSPRYSSRFYTTKHVDRDWDSLCRAHHQGPFRARSRYEAKLKEVRSS